jgi:putative ABC transport system permease protein
LALAIGASTAIFSAVDALLLRPLPYPDPDRLMVVTENLPHYGLAGLQPSFSEFSNTADWRLVFPMSRRSRAETGY